MTWTLLFALPLVLVGARNRAPAKPKQDLAAQGVEAFQAGDYPKAVTLLRKASVQQPKSAYIWFNLAKAISADNQGTTPPDECDDARNWKYLTLNALNHALALDREELLPKVKTDAKLSLFRDSAEYRKWIQSQAALPKSEAEVAEFFTKEGSWFLPIGEVTFMDLEPGGTLQRYGPTDDAKGEAEGHWRVKKSALEVTLTGGKVIRYQLSRGPWSWSLKGADGAWEPAPFLRDCTEKKK